MPKFSVIIPTYNRSRYLKTALNSVFAQTVKDYEVIVVDDGSTDDTRSFLEPYGSRLRYIFQANQGRSKARNTGLRLAQGDLIAFLDSDDAWLPDKLERQLDYLNRNPETALVHGSIQVIQEDGKPNSRMSGHMRSLWIRSNGKGVSYEDWALECRCLLSTVVVRRQALEQIADFDGTIRANEELDFYLRLAARHKIGFVSGGPLIDYRIHPGNSGSDNLSKGSIQVADKHLALLESGSLPVNRRKAWRNFQLRLSRSYFLLGDKENGRKHFLNAALKDVSSIWISPHLRLFAGSFV